MDSRIRIPKADLYDLFKNYDRPDENDFQALIDECYNEDGTITLDDVKEYVASCGFMTVAEFEEAIAPYATKDYVDNRVDVVGDTRLTIKIGNDTYVLNGMEKLVKPNTPTLTAGGTFNKSKSVTISDVVSGGTAKYTIDGGVTQTGTSFTLSQDTSVKTKSYTVVAWVEKNGMSSDTVTATYDINRKVESPDIAFDGNKYALSRTITITCATDGATLEYKIGDGSWTAYDKDNKPSVTTSGTVSARASKTDWVSTESSKSVTVGAPKCYIGQAATLTTEAQIKALAHSYELDTLVGTTKTINLGTTPEYVWFVVPKNVTIAKISSDGFAVTLQSTTGTVIGDYKAYRTSEQIKETFNFKFE